MRIFLPHPHRRHIGRWSLSPRCPVRWKSHAKLVNCDTETRQGQWNATIYQSDEITDRKSVFQAHCTQFTSTSSMDDFLYHLRSHVPRMKRASHMMYAYRASPGPLTSEVRNIGGAATTSVDIAGQDDGGESGSGDRLSRLLELSGCNDVAVVVSRWYGGVQLGNDRWKRISEVAKQSLERGGFFQTKYVQSSTTKKKRKRD
jgi:hypothetical protein